MRIKKTTPAGQCAAMRCKAQAEDLLCARHLAEWQAEGALPFETAEKPRAAAEPVLAEALEPERASAEAALRHLATANLSLTEGRDALNEIAGAAADLNARRKEALAPSKAIESAYKPLRDLYDACDTTVRTRLCELWLAAGRPELPDGLREDEEYDVEVTSLAAIPRQFLAFDESLAKAYAKHTGGGVEIPGVKVTKRAKLVRT